MNPLRRLTLWQATLLLMIPACPGDITSGVDSETTDPGACLGEPCGLPADCAEFGQGARCGALDGVHKVCFLPCDAAAAEPGCDCTPLPGPTCASDLPGCSGSCALPSHACRGS